MVAFAARTAPSPPPAGGAFAAIDLGTNNCRLLIAAPVADGFRVLDSYSRVVRLGQGMIASGQLDASAMERALAALRACAERLDRHRLTGLRAVATEACRRAQNGPAFLDRARRETGLALELISTREEAELAVESCAPLLQREGGRRALLFDIGGGSTEIAWVRLEAPGQPPVLIGYRSLPLGVVVLAERYGYAALTEAGFTAMVAEIVEHLRPFERIHCIGQEIARGGVVVLGTSGTLTTLAAVALGLPRYRRDLVDGAVLPRHDAERALAELRSLGREGLCGHPCVGPERADYVLPGCAVVAAIDHVWPAAHAVVADRGLREGILLRMMRAARAQHRRHPPHLNRAAARPPARTEPS